MNTHKNCLARNNHFGILQPVTKYCPLRKFETISCNNRFRTLKTIEMYVYNELFLTSV